jgi:excisionase family DNA binding protein
MAPSPLALAVPDELVDALAERVAERLAERDRPTPSEFMTPPEAADLLRAKTQRVYDLVSQGRLRALKDGSRLLIRRSDLDTYLEGRR